MLTKVLPVPTLDSTVMSNESSTRSLFHEFSQFTEHTADLSDHLYHGGRIQHGWSDLAFDLSANGRPGPREHNVKAEFSNSARKIEILLYRVSPCHVRHEA